MSYKPKNPDRIKQTVLSNTYEIRKELGLTQKEFGTILRVSDRTIQNYESSEPSSSLPIERAMLIHEKWDYSLDQIYLDFSKKNSFSKFYVDIRDFLSIKEDAIIFSIPDYYWEYLKEIQKIDKSDSLLQEKRRLKKRLEAKYTDKSHTIVWKYEIPISKFLSLIKFGKEEIPFGNIDNTKDFSDPTKEQLKELTYFLNEITKRD